MGSVQGLGLKDCVGGVRVLWRRSMRGRLLCLWLWLLSLMPGARSLGLCPTIPTSIRTAAHPCGRGVRGEKNRSQFAWHPRLTTITAVCLRCVVLLGLITLAALYGQQPRCALSAWQNVDVVCPGCASLRRGPPCHWLGAIGMGVGVQSVRAYHRRRAPRLSTWLQCWRSGAPRVQAYQRWGGLRAHPPGFSDGGSSAQLGRPHHRWRAPRPSTWLQIWRLCTQYVQAYHRWGAPHSPTRLQHDGLDGPEEQHGGQRAIPRTPTTRAYRQARSCVPLTRVLPTHSRMDEVLAPGPPLLVDLSDIAEEDRVQHMRLYPAGAECSHEHPHGTKGHTNGECQQQLSWRKPEAWRQQADIAARERGGRGRESSRGRRGGRGRGQGRAFHPYAHQPPAHHHHHHQQQQSQLGASEQSAGQSEPQSMGVAPWAPPVHPPAGEHAAPGQLMGAHASSLHGCSVVNNYHFHM